MGKVDRQSKGSEMPEDEEGRASFLAGTRVADRSVSFAFLIRDLSTANLRYLTSEQALADFAAFITAYRELDPEVSSSAWISFGGSYSGSLSAWMRLVTDLP